MSQAGLVTSSVSTPISIADGGTGATDKTEGFDNLSPTTTKGDVIAHDGSDNVRVAVGTDDKVLTAASSESAGIKWSTVSSVGSQFPATNQDATNSLYYYGFTGGASSGSKAIIDQRLTYIPIFPSIDTPVTALAFEVTLAAVGAVGRLGLYGDTSGLPGSKIVDGGTFDSSTTGIKELAVTTTMTGGNVYYLAFVIDENGGAASGKSQSFIAITRTISTAIYDPHFLYIQSGVDPANPLPATATPVLHNSSDAHCMCYKIN